MATGICAARRRAGALEPNARRASVRASRSIRARCRPCRRSTSFPACSSAWAVAIGTMPPCLPRRSKRQQHGQCGEVWARVEGGFQRLKPDVATAMTQDITTSLLQMGVDRRLHDGRAGQLIGGLTGQYGNASSKISTANEDGRTRTKGWGVGGTLTWQGNNGFMWMARRRPCGTEHLPFVHGRQEAGRGQRLRLCVQRGKQAHGAHRALVADAAGAAHMVVGVFRALSRCLGCRRIPAQWRQPDRAAGIIGGLPPQRTGRAWPAHSTNVYVIANLYQELLSDTRINVAGLDFGSGNDRTWGGIGVGGHHSWGGGKYALYGEVSATLRWAATPTAEGQCGRQDPMVSDRRASGQGTG